MASLLSLPSRLRWRRSEQDPEPRKTYDALVIGGGATAFAIAYELAARHGLREVALLNPGHGPTPSPGSALLRASAGALPCVGLAVRSKHRLKSLPRALRYVISVRRRPFLDLARTVDELPRLHRLADTARHAGEPAWLVPPLEARAHLPYLAPSAGPDPDPAGALFEPAVALLSPERLIQAYMQGADRARVHILDNAPVEQIRLENERAVGVRLATGPVSAGAVIVAPDHGAAPLLQAIGMPAPLAACRRLVLTTGRTNRLGPTVAALGALRGFVYQEEDGAVVIVGASGAGESRRDAAARAAGVLLGLAPGLGRLPIRREAWALAESTPDGAPLLGPVLPGLHLACGLGPHGAGLVPAIAEGVAEAVANDSAASPLVAAFALGRFDRLDDLETSSMASAA